MGTISARKKANGLVSYTAQIRIKRGGKVVYSEAETFNKKQNATLWLRNRETDLDKPGALDHAIASKKSQTGVTLGEAIKRYVREMSHIGRTKSQVLDAIGKDDIAELRCAEVTSDQLVAYAARLAEGGRQPSTVGNYLSHLAAVFSIGRAAWKYDLDPSQMQDAQKVLRKLGTVSKSIARNRRPTLEELDKIMEHFTERHTRAPLAVPMHLVIPFALFSTRRQEEIVRVTWEDYDKAHSRVLVRDMKHPGQKIGNDIWCDLPSPVPAIISLMAKVDDRIFPYTSDAISASFTRVCAVLDIKDLHFHDLRHEGVSRLFEMGKTIPQAASVSGHRSWSSLQRYTHIKQAGDKYERWPWLKKLGIAEGSEEAGNG
jgi:integrase